jgi:hypothetical protein
MTIAYVIPFPDSSSKGLDLANAMGSMYTAVFFIGVQNSASVQPVVAVERTVFYREKAAGMYSALPYALAQVIIKSLFHTKMHWFMLRSHTSVARWPEYMSIK